MFLCFLLCFASLLRPRKLPAQCTRAARRSWRGWCGRAAPRPAARLAQCARAPAQISHTTWQPEIESKSARGWRVVRSTRSFPTQNVQQDPLVFALLGRVRRAVATPPQPRTKHLPDAHCPLCNEQPPRHEQSSHHATFTSCARCSLTL